MKVTSYGLFWRTSEIDWAPGKGNRNKFRLLGRVGANRGTLRVANFRRQRGIYILYDEYGPCYVGLTKKRGLGQRLKEHLTDHLGGCWDRFSWFGFWEVEKAASSSGIFELNKPANDLSEDTNTTIGDLEALLIRAIGPKHNSAGMNFKSADQWFQLGADDIDTYLARL